MSPLPRLTADALAEMRSAGASVVSLSLDGARPETHDAFRGFEGVYEQTLEAATLVHAAGLRLQINTTVTRDNVHELPAVLETVESLGAGLWSVFFLVPTGRGSQLRTLDALSVERVLEWLASVSSRVAVKTTEAPHFRRVMLQQASSGVDPQPARRARRPPMDVNAGRGFAFVDHLGFVHPSGFLPLKAGSVREQLFTAIYRDSPLLRSLRDPAQLGGRCGRCEYVGVCGGSRSRAYAETGDPLAEDPACVWEPTGAR